jgi:hypothetical protein
MKKLLFVVTAAAVLAQSAGMRADVVEQVLVKVNGDIITKTELEQRQVAALRQRLNNQTSIEMLKNDEQLKALAEITPRVLVNAIDELLRPARQGLGLHLGDATVQTGHQQHPQGAGASGRQSSLTRSRRNMTMDDLRKQLERQCRSSRCSASRQS